MATSTECIRKRDLLGTSEMQLGLGLKPFGGDSLFGLVNVGRHWVDAMYVQLETSGQTYDITSATTADVDSHCGPRGIRLSIIEVCGTATVGFLGTAKS